jgi:hypothetical protein
MDDMARRSFVKGAAAGALAFTVGGAEVWLTAAQARAQGVPFRTLAPPEVATLEALGETLAIGAREGGIAHFVDQQLSVPPEDALLSLRVSEARPPYVDFYRATFAGVEGSSRALYNIGYADLGTEQQHDFVDLLRQSKLASWQGPAQATVYATLRNDAIDVVYGTVEGFAKLGIPYMPHILPARSW